MADLVFVRLLTGEGLDGSGEAVVLGGPNWSEESAESIQATCACYLGPAIQGLDPLAPGAVLQAMVRAVSGNPFAKAARHSVALAPEPPKRKALIRPG